MSRQRLLYALVMLYCLCSGSLYAQFAKVQAVAQPVSLCGPNTTFSVVLNPGALASTGNIITVTLPAGVQYVAGTATVDNGATIGSVGGTATAPVFNIASLAGASDTHLNFNVTANCSYAGGQTFTASASGSVGTTPGTSSAFNANAPVLNLSATNLNFSGALLTSYTRTITVQNSGVGAVDTILIKDTVGNARIVTALTGAGGETVTLVSKTGLNSGNDTAYVWKVSGLTADGHLAQGESVNLTQSLTIVKCNNTADRLWTELNCVGTSTCGRGFAVGGVNIPAVAQPAFTITPAPVTYPLYPCTDGSTPYTQSVLVTNSASAGPAYNVHIVVGVTDDSYIFSQVFSNMWVDANALQMKLNTGSYAPVSSDSTVNIAAAGKCADGKSRLARITIPVLNPGDSVRIQYNVYNCTNPLASCTSQNEFRGYTAAQVGYTASCQTGPETKTSPVQLTPYSTASHSASKASGLSTIYPGQTYTLTYSQNAVFGPIFPNATTLFAYEVKVPAFLSLSRSLTDVAINNKVGGAYYPFSITQLAASY